MNNETTHTLEYKRFNSRADAVAFAKDCDLASFDFAKGIEQTPICEDEWIVWYNLPVKLQQEMKKEISMENWTRFWNFMLFE